MKYVRRTAYALLLAAMANYIPLFVLICFISEKEVSFTFGYWMTLLAAFLSINICPLPKTSFVGL